MLARVATTVSPVTSRKFTPRYSTNAPLMSVGRGDSVTRRSMHSALALGRSVVLLVQRVPEHHPAERSEPAQHRPHVLVVDELHQVAVGVLDEEERVAVR